MRALSLSFVLSAFWLLSSGHFVPLLLGFMAIGVVMVVLLARRLAILDAEGHPTHLIARGLRYWPWLIGQVVKSNIDVVRVIFAPRERLAPQLVRIPIAQTDDLGRTIHANSVTLTPGTLACEVDDDAMLVHCLTPEIARDLAGGEFDRQVDHFHGRTAR